VSCNTAGYHYEIKAVVNNDMRQPLESTASNIVPAANEPPLTGCYTVSSFAPPASARQGNSVSVIWTLTDDEYVSPGTPWANAQANNPVTRQAANTLVAIGPDPNNCANNKRTILVSDGVATNLIQAPEGQGPDTFTNNGNTFTFTWNNTDAFCAGQYTFELDLDHVSGSPAQTNTSATLLALGVDVNDQDGIVVNYVPLTDGTVGVAYTVGVVAHPYTFTQHGGVGAITWSISKGSLPNGMTIDPGSGTILGYATTACQCQFTVTATDSKGNVGSQQFTLTMHIWVSASAAPASPPFVANQTLPAMTVGVNSPDTVYQSGAVGSVTWNISGTFPSGISQQGSSATISGTTCSAGSYALNAAATDSANNTGSLGLTLPVNKANTTTTVASSTSGTSVFQQPVTFTVTVAPQYSCTPGGTVTLFIDGVQFGSAQQLTNGSASFGPLNTLTVGNHSITASYGGDNNFTSSSSAVLAQTVNPAQTVTSSPAVSSPSTVFVGQPVTISFGFSVQSPGAGSPIPPSGNILVTASDGSYCTVSAATATALLAGACQLQPPPTKAGNVTYAINYPGTTPADPNFIGSGANGNYNVYQLVFTTQPSNTGVGNTITPAVQVTAEDSTGATLTGFGGGITVAKGSGPGTLSGTLTQSAVAGVATFPDLSINKVATGDTLVASPAGGVPAATSNAFNITLALNYTQLTQTPLPGPRCCGAMAYDPISMSTLLFGGTQTFDNMTYSIMNDTWQLKNGQWNQLSLGTSPPPRSGAAMVYDAAHNNIVLFGGTTGSSDLNDTWIWNGSTWTLITPPTSPPGRRFDSQGMAYDPNMQAVVMFGGIDYTSKIFYNDTWVWNGTTWTQMGSPASSPSARRSVLATDPSGNVMLFGGGGPSGAVLGDTWVWDGTNWNQQSPATSPAARDLHNMAFNPNVGAVVLFAGGGGLNDVWSWDGTTWTQVTPAAAAPQRYAFGMDYDGAANAIFVFGGFTTNGPAINDTWEFTVSP